MSRSINHQRTVTNNEQRRTLGALLADVPFHENDQARLLEIEQLAGAYLGRAVRDGNHELEHLARRLETAARVALAAFELRQDARRLIGQARNEHELAQYLLPAPPAPYRSRHGRLM